MSRTELGRYVLQYPIPFLLFLLCVYVLYLLLLVRPWLLRVAASLETKPCTWLFVSQSFLSNIREPSGFLDVLMSATTFPGSALLPVLSPSSNLVVRYCLTSYVNPTAWLRGLCKAHSQVVSHYKKQKLHFCHDAHRYVPLVCCRSPCCSQQYGIFPPNLFWVCHIHRFGAPAFLTVFANIKMTLKVTEFLEHCLTSRLKAEEETTALFLVTWRSFMDSSPLDWKKVYIYNKIFWTLELYDRVLVGNDYILPHAITSPNPNSV